MREVGVTWSVTFWDVPPCLYKLTLRVHVCPLFWLYQLTKWKWIYDHNHHFRKSFLSPRTSLYMYITAVYTSNILVYLCITIGITALPSARGLVFSYIRTGTQWLTSQQMKVQNGRYRPTITIAVNPVMLFPTGQIRTAMTATRRQNLRRAWSQLSPRLRPRNIMSLERFRGVEAFSVQYRTDTFAAPLYK